jgi:hypothetical protein
MSPVLKAIFNRLLYYKSLYGLSQKNGALNPQGTIPGDFSFTKHEQ